MAHADTGKVRVRTDTWRLDSPSDRNSPLAIRRLSPLNARRQAYPHIFAAGGDTDESDGSGDDVRHLIRGGGRNKKTNIKAAAAYEKEIVTVAEAKQEDKGVQERHVRFLSPETVVTGLYEFGGWDMNQRHSAGNQDSFVVAFGQRGKGVASFEDAKDIVFTQEGKLLVTDLILGRIQIFNKETKQVLVIASGDTRFPWGAANIRDDIIMCSFNQEGCVKWINTNGNILKTFGHDGLSCPTGVAISREENFVVCDEKLNKVFVFSEEGDLLGSLGNPNEKEEAMSKPRYACVAQDGDFIISDSGNHCVKIFDNHGKLKRSFGSFGKENGQFKSPYGLCTNQYGDIIVADHYNSRISMFTKNGDFIRHLVTREHGLIHPQGVTMDRKMYLYITHGRLRATEVLVFKMENRFPDIQYTGGSSHL